MNCLWFGLLELGDEASNIRQVPEPEKDAGIIILPSDLRSEKNSINLHNI